MKKGDTVSWISQAQGYVKHKTGVIVRVLAPDERPSPREVKGAGWGRDHESYIVKVGNKLYWPRVSALERALEDYE